MKAIAFPARQTRTQHRHPLHTLIYVTVDEGNGGIIRNLSHEGLSVQAVARLRPEQRVRLRFELKSPRVKVDAHGEVAWSDPAGQCGIRFLDLVHRERCLLDEWIFSKLLENVSREVLESRSMFGSSVAALSEEEVDGLIVSTAARTAIRLKSTVKSISPKEDEDCSKAQRREELSWLSRPLSTQTLAWMVDSLVVAVGFLLFALIFLLIAHGLPQWQLTLTAALGAVVFVGASYWILFAMLGRVSLGARLAQTAAGEQEERTERRFR